MSQNVDLPIGVFDSGVGGLTVLKEVIAALPAEDIIYIGDTARVPYGTKSGKEIIRATRENIDFLVSLGVKAVIVACNSASSVGLPALSGFYPLPVMGVVKAGCKAAAASGKKRIGVIGTRATISSGAYQQELAAEIEGAEIHCQSCPLFVPLVEEAWLDGEITMGTAEKYLGSMRGRIDALILGCTHYPLLKDVISRVLPDVELIDSAAAAAKRAADKLEAAGLICGSRDRGGLRFFLTDNAPNFQSMSRMILGNDVPEPEVVCFQ